MLRRLPRYRALTIRKKKLKNAGASYFCYRTVFQYKGYDHKNIKMTSKMLLPMCELVALVVFIALQCHL